MIKLMAARKVAIIRFYRSLFLSFFLFYVRFFLLVNNLSTKGHKVFVKYGYSYFFHYFCARNLLLHV